MNKIDKYLDRVCSELSGPTSLREHIREELRQHIEDAIAARLEKGQASEQAQQQVLEEFGEPEMMRTELQSIYGKRITAFMIHRAMDWKEKNMTTEWKWNFTSQFGMLLILTVQILLISFVGMYILPQINEYYYSTGIEMPRYAKTLFQSFDFLMYHGYLLLPVLIICVALFEWRFRKSSKSRVRLAIIVWLTFVTAVTATTTSITATVAQISVTRHGQANHKTTSVNNPDKQETHSIVR